VKDKSQLSKFLQKAMNTKLRLLNMVKHYVHLCLPHVSLRVPSSSTSPLTRANSTSASIPGSPTAVGHHAVPPAVPRFCSTPLPASGGTALGGLGAGSGDQQLPAKADATLEDLLTFFDAVEAAVSGGGTCAIRVSFRNQALLRWVGGW
jgi:hypothetical protein